MVGTEDGNGEVHQTADHSAKPGIKANGRDQSIINTKQFFKFCKAFVRVFTHLGNKTWGSSNQRIDNKTLPCEVYSPVDSIMRKINSTPGISLAPQSLNKAFQTNIKFD